MTGSRTRRWPLVLALGAGGCAKLLGIDEVPAPTGIDGGPVDSATPAPPPGASEAGPDASPCPSYASPVDAGVHCGRNQVCDPDISVRVCCVDEAGAACGAPTCSKPKWQCESAGQCGDGGTACCTGSSLSSGAACPRLLEATNGILTSYCGGTGDKACGEGLRLCRATSECPGEMICEQVNIDSPINGVAGVCVAKP